MARGRGSWNPLVRMQLGKLDMDLLRKEFRAQRQSPLAGLVSEHADVQGCDMASPHTDPAGPGLGKQNIQSRVSGAEGQFCGLHC